MATTHITGQEAGKVAVGEVNTGVGGSLKLVANDYRQECIEYAEALLTRCKNGEVISITFVEQNVGGDYLIYGSPIADRHKTAGMLLEAAMTRLSTT